MITIKSKEVSLVIFNKNNVIATIIIKVHLLGGPGKIKWGHWCNNANAVPSRPWGLQTSHTQM